MNKFLAGLFAAGLLLSAAPALQAAQGVRPERTTYQDLSAHAEVIVKAKLVEVRDVAVDPETNVDVQMHRFHNSNEAVRRDAVLMVTEVLRGSDVFTGDSLEIVSPTQWAFSQFPQSLQDGEEGYFFIVERQDGLQVLGGETRGMLTSEDGAGSLARVGAAIKDVMAYSHRFVLDEEQRLGFTQERLMREVTLDASRMSLDSLLELTYSIEEYKPYFDSFEQAALIDLLNESEAGSAERLELITLIGRVQPVGGEFGIIETVVADASERVAARAADALEQYGTAESCSLLLDRYLEIEADNHVAKARVITTLGILRPYNKHADEVGVRLRVTDLLRTVLHRDSNSLVLQEALLAARDMRYTNNELGTELTRLIEDFREGLVSDVVYKRAIVALAATRTAAAKEQLEELKSEFDGRYAKHIELSLASPFTQLVDGK